MWAAWRRTHGVHKRVRARSDTVLVNMHAVVRILYLCCSIVQIALRDTFADCVTVSNMFCNTHKKVRADVVRVELELSFGPDVNLSPS